MFSDSVVNAMLDDIPATYGDMEVGLSSTTPVVSGGVITNVTEPAGGGYARASLPTGYWNLAANRTKVTNTDIDFLAPTSDWGFITHAVIYDASTGTPLFYGQLTQTVNIVGGGQSLKIAAGTISLALPL